MFSTYFFCLLQKLPWEEANSRTGLWVPFAGCCMLQRRNHFAHSKHSGCWVNAFPSVKVTHTKSTNLLQGKFLWKLMWTFKHLPLIIFCPKFQKWSFWWHKEPATKLPENHLSLWGEKWSASEIINLQARASSWAILRAVTIVQIPVRNILDRAAHAVYWLSPRAGESFHSCV